jgi:predicted phage gp36 major capsid-like protein
MKSKQLREQRAKLVTDIRALMPENAQLTAELREKIAGMEKDLDTLNSDIELAERQESREREMATRSTPVIDPNAPTLDGGDAEKRKTAEIEKEAREYGRVFNIYARRGTEGMSAEERSILQKGYRDKEGRAQSFVTGSAGGFLVPQGFQAELERAQLHFGGVRQISRILPTTGGNPLPWPKVDDTGNSGEDKAENVAAAGQDIAFDQRHVECIQDGLRSRLDPERADGRRRHQPGDRAGSLLGERLGRRQNAKYTTGSGSSDYQGCVVSATLGVTAAGTAAITADELINLQHSVDPAYRANPKAAFMMNDDTIKFIRKLKDSNGRYLLDYTTLPGQPTTLLGKPLITNQDMATLATGNKTVLFGDFNKFIIRDVRNIVLRRLNERYADADQTGFIAWYRGDSRLVSASTKALRYLVQA